MIVLLHMFLNVLLNDYVIIYILKCISKLIKCILKCISKLFCIIYILGQCGNKECPFLHIDPDKKIKDCPWYDRGFCRHGN